MAAVSMMCVQPLAAAETPAAKPADAAPKEQAPVQQKKQPTKEELFSDPTIKKISETYGHLVAKGLDNPVIKLNFEAVIQGMRDAKAKKPSPMNEEEYEEAINLIQEYAFQDLAVKNMQEADKYLKENASKPGVKELEAGKLQYMILQEGKGDVVTEELRPTVNYTGKYIDGTVFGSSETSGGPVSLSLKQTIPGFRKGIAGMKVGEKRRLFVHPEMGYGTSGQLLPNSLLIFEVEVTDVKPEPKKPEPKKDATKDGSKDAKKTTDVSDDEDDNDSSGEDELALGDNLFPDELEEECESDDDGDDDFEVEPEEAPKKPSKAVAITEPAKG
ncbi:MAG TPA: FKBP-type peptidyl-prolyl cis-trans isomerase [Chlamydiales bacterium]|nr:FKBP-type peptidyl-prolyl cis-trans isomerase [Chlamydiales bacterium]